METKKKKLKAAISRSFKDNIKEANKEITIFHSKCMTYTCMG